jgi:polyisoprenoid-binding protein YceI
VTQDHALKIEATLLPGTYRLDPESTVVAFSARKFGLFTIRGTMKLREGTFMVTDPISRSTVDAILAAGTFTTPMARRDAHVRSKGLLDTATFPTIEFLGTGVKRSPSGWAVLGTLAVHGQRHDVTLAIEALRQDGDIVHLEAAAQIDRNDFGVTHMRIAAGPKVDIHIDAVATRA